ALVDAPEARSGAGEGGWVEPDDDGACPISHPIKANDNSGIFHVPGGRFYERTKAERCYADETGAEADGYRRAKS
ncbi:MAG: nuclease, partial [Actinomycetota bacterium]